MVHCNHKECPLFWSPFEDYFRECKKPELFKEPGYLLNIYYILMMNNLILENTYTNVY